KQAHWNVKGPQFIALHKLFDEINDAVVEYVDLLAERVVQLGGTAEGTARVVAERSELPEYPLTISTGEEHVWALSSALSNFGERIRRAIDQTADLGDVDSSDICTEISRGTDKWLWFVESHAEGAVRAHPPERGELEHPTGGERVGAEPWLLDQGGEAHLGEHVEPVVAGRAVRPDGDVAPRGQQLRHLRHAARELQVGRRAVHHRG